MNQKNVLVIFGTRPEAIKMAPLVKELESAPGLTPIVCVTAQHRAMLDQVLRFFEIQTQTDLNVMKEGQSLYSLSADLLKGMEKVFQARKYDLVWSTGIQRQRLLVLWQLIMRRFLWDMWKQGCGRMINMHRSQRR